MKLPNYTLVAILVVSMATFFTACDDTKVGCTDPTAANYDPDAEESDDSCIYPPDHNVRFKVEANVDGLPFEMNSTYVNAANQAYNVAFFQFYLSHITLIAEDDSEVELAEVVLYDMSDDDPSITTTVPAGNYKAVRFGVGLDEELNNTDPTILAADHPLSWNQGTHWAWIKYRFIMMEGKVDANPDATILENDYAYHTGLDVLFREVTLNRSVTVTSMDDITDETVGDVSISLNVNRIFGETTDPLDMIAEPVTHSEGDEFALAQLLTNNFVDALE